MLLSCAVKIPSPAPAIVRTAVPVCVLVVVFVYTLAAAYHIHRVNTEIVKADQGAYITYARQMSATQYSVVGGRNQMPVYPAIISLIVRPEQTPERLFEQAKYLNVVISIVVLFGIYFLVRRSVPVFESLTLTLIVAFTVYVYRAGYVQSELLFYGLFFLSFLLALSSLAKPHFVVAGLAGLAMGIAYLTKASVLPLLVAYSFWGVVGALRARKSAEEQRSTVRAVAVTALVSLIFLVTVFPYIQTSKQQFGRWFYNVNTTIYMWADSWDEVKHVMSGTGDREHWPDVAPELLPSPTRYFSEHSVGQIAQRIAAGMWTSEFRHLVEKPFGYGKYLIFYALIALAVVARTRERVVEACFANGRWIETAFVVSVVAGYMIAYAFYSPIVRGPRLILALYVPTMFSIFWLLSRKSIAEQPLWSSERYELRMNHVHAAALVSLAIDVVFRLPNVIITTFAGA